MVKKIKIFDSISRLVKPPVSIYRAPIHKVYATGFNLVKGEMVYTKKDTIVNDKGTFVRSGLSFWNIEYDIKLPDIEEAEVYCESTIGKKKDTVVKVLSNSDSNETNRILKGISDDTGCVYYIPGEVVYDRTISNDEYKKLRKINKIK